MQPLLSAATLECANAVWARFLGCSPADIASASGATVVMRTPPTHGGIEVFFPATATGCVVSLPPGVDATLRESLVWKRPISSHTEVVDRVKHTFARQIERTIGPGYLGYADAATFRPAPSFGAPITIRQLSQDSDEDRSILDRFAAECPPDEWSASGVSLDHPPVFGAFLGQSGDGASQLVAAGKLQKLPPESQNVQHIGIVTHPDHRGRSYGKALVSAMCQHALIQGAVLQYRTLFSNTPSIAIARGLRFTDYATTYAFRLRT